MKIEINADEAKLILNHRAWSRLLNMKGRRVEFGYFIVMCPIVLVVFSTAFLFMNVNNIVPSVFLALGLLSLPVTLRALKRFKVLQTQIQSEMIEEEKKEAHNG